MGFATSLRNISEGVVNYFKGKTGVTYPFESYMTPFLSSAEDVKGIQENWMYNCGYAFAVIKQDEGKYTGYTAKDKNGKDSEVFGEFVLNINPQNITMREPFSIDIVPTQTGVVVQHSGSVLKDIVIAGTTGIHPLRGPGGVTNSDVSKFFASRGKGQGSSLPVWNTNKEYERDISQPPDSEKNKAVLASPKPQYDKVANFLRGGTGILNGEPPGFYHFHMLRNYIRSYVQSKTRIEYSDAFLVFRNKKDNEDWIVEPIEFVMERSAKSPFIYNYRIVLRALKKVTIEAGKEKDILGGFGKFLDALKNVEDVIKVSSDLINTGAQALNASAGYITQLSQDFNVTVMGPINALSNLLAGVRNASNAVLAVPRTFVESLNGSVTTLIRRVEDVSGCGNNTYNTRVGRVSTAKNVSIYRTPTLEEIGILKALNTVQKGLITLLATDQPFSKELLQDSSYNIDAFNTWNNVSLSTKGKIALKKGSIENTKKLFNNELIIKTPNSAYTDIVRSGENLQDIAVRTLGDVSRWYDIVLLNQLKYPYIDTIENKSLGVVAPGSVIYIPSSSSVISKGVIRGRTTYITQNLSEVEKSLGVDLELTADNDLRINARQDLDLVAGAQNAAQAIYISLMLESGSLKYHQYKGVNLSPGTKDAGAARDVIESVRRSIVSDPRFDSVSNLSVSRVNTTLLLNMNVQVSNLGKNIPLEISI